MQLVGNELVTYLNNGRNGYRRMSRDEKMKEDVLNSELAPGTMHLYARIIENHKGTFARFFRDEKGKKLSKPETVPFVDREAAENFLLNVYA